MEALRNKKGLEWKYKRELFVVSYVGKGDIARHWVGQWHSFSCSTTAWFERNVNKTKWVNIDPDIKTPVLDHVHGELKEGILCEKRYTVSNEIQRPKYALISSKGICVSIGLLIFSACRTHVRCQRHSISVRWHYKVYVTYIVLCKENNLE